MNPLAFVKESGHVGSLPGRNDGAKIIQKPMRGQFLNDVSVRVTERQRRARVMLAYFNRACSHV